MTMEDDARSASTKASRRPRWPRTAVAIGSLAVAGAGLLASTELHGIPSLHATPQAQRAAVGAAIVLADDAPPPPTRSLMAAPASARTLPPGSPLIGAFKGSPESRLIGIYRAIGQQQTDVALDAAASLTHDVPGFRLAQLVYADLLAARTGNTAGFGAAGAASASNPAVAAEIGELHDEALQRLHALEERPPAGQVPAEFVMLPKAIHHAIAVDTTRSRLYLFENGAQGLRLVSDHYVSVGKQGVDKSVEGDQRTPLGVYFVSDRVGQGSLGEAFGAGAMQLNYPNLLDQLHGRTGSGIYVHGVPFNTYSRPPKDSDGCVTLANDELVMLMNTVPDPRHARHHHASDPVGVQRRQPAAPRRDPRRRRPLAERAIAQRRRRAAGVLRARRRSAHAGRAAGAPAAAHRGDDPRQAPRDPAAGGASTRPDLVRQPERDDLVGRQGDHGGHLQRARHALAPRDGAAAVLGTRRVEVADRRGGHGSLNRGVSRRSACFSLQARRMPTRRESTRGVPP